MSNEWGQIVMTWREVQVGPHHYMREIERAQWEGPPVTLVDDDLARNLLGHEPQVGHVVEIGDYLVRLHRLDYAYLAWEAHRLDSAGGLLLWWYGFRRWRCRLGMQILITAAIWGLADYPPEGYFLNWSEIRQLLRKGRSR